VAGKSWNGFKWNIDDTSMGQFVLSWHPTTRPEFTGTGFSPRSGPPGTKVTLRGINFTGATSVLFNGVSADFTVTSDLRITTTVPLDATTGPITVVTPAGSVTSANEFKVPAPFVRGDTNADSAIDLSDAIWILGFLFRGSPETLSCEKSADTNDDQKLDLSDAVALLNHLFRGAAAPPPPYPGSAGTRRARWAARRLGLASSVAGPSRPSRWQIPLAETAEREEREVSQSGE